MPTNDEYTDATDNGSNVEQDDLRSLTERIQVGDTDEGAAALGEIINRARGAATVDRNTVRTLMLEEAAQMKLRDENTRALDRFGSRFPQLKDDNLLVDAAQRVLRDRIVDDLKGAGASDDDLAPVREDTGRLIAAHGQARVRGLKLSSPDELLDHTGRVLTEKFHIKPVRRSPEEYVHDLRKSRGFADDASGQVSAKAPASSGSSSDRTAAHVQRLRAARGYPATRQAGSR
jgi:hypothetical protein